MVAPQSPITFPTDAEAARAAVVAAGPVELTIGHEAAEAPNVARAAALVAAELGAGATVTVLPTGAAISPFENPEAAPDLVLARRALDAAHPETLTGVFYATDAPINLFQGLRARGG